MREPYMITDGEIQILLQGAVKFGLKQTYARVREKVAGSIGIVNDVDEMIMDMHDGILKKVRSMDPSNDVEIKEQMLLYQIASMFRHVAHDIHRKYNRVSESKRFLELIVNNKDIPNRIWRK